VLGPRGGVASELTSKEHLRCLIRIVPLLAADRMLELAPLFWERSRARLDAV
jgi:hypothetical protein